VLDEYLEKVVEASFKREFEQDENIVRSLPFFAAALGLAVAIFAQIVIRMPPQNTALGWALTVILLLAGGAFACTLWSLFQLVRAREFKVPPNEQSLVEWGQQLVEFYRGQRKSVEKAEEAAKNDVRKRMIDAYAEAAVANREANSRKFKSRSFGFMSIIALITLATIAAGVIFIGKQMERIHDPKPGAGQTQVQAPLWQARSSQECGQGPVRDNQKAVGSGASHGGSRSQVSIRSGSEELSHVGRNETTSTSTTSAAPTANPSAHGDRQKEH